MFGLLGPEKTVRKNKKQIWSVSLMLLKNIFEMSIVDNVASIAQWQSTGLVNQGS